MKNGLPSLRWTSSVHELDRQLRSREPRRRVLLDVRGRQPAERELAARALADELAFDLHHGVVAHDRIGLPQRAEHEQPCRLAAVGEQGHQVQRRVVAPVHVLEDEGEGDVRRERVQADGQPVQRVLVRAADGLVAADPRRLSRCRRAQHPAGRVLAKRGLDRRTVGSATEAGDRFEHRHVRLAAAVLLDALATRHPKSGFGRTTHLSERHVDERRLADPRLARDEAHLAAPAHRRAHPGEQLGALRAATHHDRVRIAGMARCGLGRLAHGRHEAVAPPRHRLDEPRSRTFVSERRPQLADRHADHVLRHRDVSPDGVEQRLLRDQLAGVLGQMHEDGEGLRPEGHRRARAAELPGAEVEVERGERDVRRGGAGEGGMPPRPERYPARAGAAMATDRAADGVFTRSGHRISAGFPCSLRTSGGRSTYRCDHAEAAATSRHDGRIAAAPGSGVRRAAAAPGRCRRRALRGSHRAHYLGRRRALRLGGGPDHVPHAGAGTGRRDPGRSRASGTNHLHRGGIMKRLATSCLLTAPAAASGGDPGAAVRGGEEQARRAVSFLPRKGGGEGDPDDVRAGLLFGAIVDGHSKLWTLATGESRVEGRQARDATVSPFGHECRERSPQRQRMEVRVAPATPRLARPCNC